MEAAPTLRERKRADTRERIEAAALALFLRDGYDHVTVAGIAAVADVAPRTFFRYFPAKEDVLFGRDDEVAKVIADAVATRPADEPPADTVRAVLHAMADWTQDNAELVRRRAQVMADTPALLGRDAGKRRRLDLATAVLLRRRTGAAARDPAPDVLARTASVAYDVGVEQWLARGGSLRAHIDRALAALPAGGA